MSHDDDAGEDVLAPVDLHAWRVPPPCVVDRSAILARVLSPVTPPTRSRVTWMVAAIAIVNVVLAAVLVIVISRRPPRTITMLQPAGGGDVNAQMQQLLHRLEQEQRELEGKLADVQQLRTVVEHLSERVRQCEEADRSVRPEPRPRREAPPPPDLSACNDASCAKVQAPAQPPSPNPNPSRALPDTLDRDGISAGIDSVRQQVQACGQRSTAKGNVMVRVRVNPAGRVETVLIASTPDPALGACVASMVQKAIFEPTHHGGAFSYPFVFGATP